MIQSLSSPFCEGFFYLLFSQQPSKLCKLLRESGDAVVSGLMVGTVETDGAFSTILLKYSNLIK